MSAPRARPLVAWLAVAALAVLLGTKEGPRMTAPLELVIKAQKPRTIAGEGIRIEIERRLERALEMDTVELNEDRTRVRIARLDDERAPARELTGRDHSALHHVHPLKPIGRRYTDKPGVWTSTLELWNYTRPLPPGRYEISLSYRWGDTPDETVRSNAVSVAVAPARGLAFEPRWLPSDRVRGSLGSIWTAADGATTRWVFEEADPEDPSVKKLALDLEMPAVAPVASPRLAQPSLRGMGREHYAVWLEKGALGWVPFLPEKRLAPPTYQPHGLAEEPAPRLVDPPLRRHEGGLAALVVGRDAKGTPTASLTEVDTSMKAVHRSFALPFDPTHALVLWGEEEAPPTGTLYLAAAPDEDGVIKVVAHDIATGETRGVVALAKGVRLRALALEPGFNGMGKLLALTERGDAEKKTLGVTILDLASAALTTRDVKVEEGAPTPDALVAATPLDEGSGLALLYRAKNGWLVRTPEKSRTFDAREGGATPQLVTTAHDGLFLVSKDPRTSFTFVGDPPPDHH